MPKALGFGSGGSSSSPLPTSFSARSPAFSLSGSFDPVGGVSGSLTRLGSVPQTAFDERFPRFLQDIDTLRGTITPGFSQLREVASREVSNARVQAIGNLRENLARRRILGSSFGEDALVRAEAEFGELAARTQTQSFLTELEANMKVLGFEFEQVNTALQREFQEIGLAAGFATNIGQIVSQNQQFAQQLAAQSAAGRGQLLGSLVGLGVSSTGFGGSFGAGGAFATSAADSSASSAALSAMLMSDRRLKTDVSRIGSLPNGLPVYRFRYVWGGPERIGVMAQDVERVMPVAVAEIAGYKAVNYDMVLGV